MLPHVILLPIASIEMLLSNDALQYASQVSELSSKALSRKASSKHRSIVGNICDEATTYLGNVSVEATRGDEGEYRVLLIDPVHLAWRGEVGRRGHNFLYRREDVGF